MRNWHRTRRSTTVAPAPAPAPSYSDRIHAEMVACLAAVEARRSGLDEASCAAVHAQAYADALEVA